MTYQPQPGTICHRAIAWMRSMQKSGNHGPFPTSEVCEALGIETWGFAPFMRVAREAGLVYSERIPGHGMHVAWGLGSGKPDPGMNARPIKVSGPPKPLKFRAVEFQDKVIVVGVEIRRGAAVFTREQIAQLAGATWN